MTRYAPDRLRLWKIRSGMSACLLRASISRNAVSRMAAAARDATTLVSPQCETPSGVVAATDRP